MTHHSNKSFNVHSDLDGSLLKQRVPEIDLTNLKIEYLSAWPDVTPNFPHSPHFPGTSLKAALVSSTKGDIQQITLLIG